MEIARVTTEAFHSLAFDSLTFRAAIFRCPEGSALDQPCPRYLPDLHPPLPRQILSLIILLQSCANSEIAQPDVHTGSRLTCLYFRNRVTRFIHRVTSDLPLSICCGFPSSAPRYRPCFNLVSYTIIFFYASKFGLALTRGYELLHTRPMRIDSPYYSTSKPACTPLAQLMAITRPTV